MARAGRREGGFLGAGSQRGGSAVAVEGLWWWPRELKSRSRMVTKRSSTLSCGYAKIRAPGLFFPSIDAEAERQCAAGSHLLERGDLFEVLLQVGIQLLGEDGAEFEAVHHQRVHALRRLHRDGPRLTLRRAQNLPLGVGLGLGLGFRAAGSALIPQRPRPLSKLGAQHTALKVILRIQAECTYGVSNHPRLVPLGN